jgi:hypothetical protein
MSKSHFTENELIELVEQVLSRPMSEEDKRRFREKMALFNDPRYGYGVIDDQDVVLLRLSGGNYVLRQFSGGVGFSPKREGGLADYIDDALLEKMVAEKLITRNGTILPAGHIEYGKFLERITGKG